MYPGNFSAINKRLESNPSDTLALPHGASYAIHDDLVPILMGKTQEHHPSLPTLSELPSDELAGWPQQVHHPLVWRGSDFASEDEYIYHLSEQDLAEIDHALTHFKNLELDGSDINQSNFPLPVLAEKLKALSVDLHEGKGFFLLRGLASKELSSEDNALLFLGLSSYIAETRGKQDEEGSMLLHIRNAVEMKAPQADRPARDSNTVLAFHTDQFNDVLALQTRGCAESGGNHNIVSSYTIYNELAATRPDVLETLARPDWYFDKRSLFSRPERRALLFNHGGHIIFNFGRIHLMPVDPYDDGTLPSQPSAKQREALELVQQIANKNQLSLDMKVGDLIFINNLGLLHAREAFVDSLENTRYLVRLWLKNKEKAWDLPPTLEMGNSRTYDESSEESWNILPGPRVTFNVREKNGP